MCDALQFDNISSDWLYSSEVGFFDINVSPALPTVFRECSNGIIGVIESTGENYSSVISILNKNLQVNAKLKKSNYFGSLSWPGKDRSKFALIDIPKEAIINIGDTVATGGYSTIFPEGINIGIIEKFEIKENQNYYDITVKPFLDYADIKSVYIIHNLHKEKIKEVESQIID